MRYFLIDWGNGNIELTDLYPSDSDVRVKHTWQSSGSFKIRVKAVESYLSYGFQSQYYGFLSINIPKTKQLPILVFSKLRQLIPPKLNEILNQIIRL